MDISDGLKRAESFLTYINQTLDRIDDGEGVLDESDNQVGAILYDVSPVALSMSVMTSGIVRFAKQQFILGMLWERYKNTEGDGDLNDLLRGVKGL